MALLDLVKERNESNCEARQGESLRTELAKPTLDNIITFWAELSLFLGNPLSKSFIQIETCFNWKIGSVSRHCCRMCMFMNEHKTRAQSQRNSANGEA